MLLSIFMIPSFTENTLIHTRMWMFSSKGNQDSNVTRYFLSNSLSVALTIRSVMVVGSWLWKNWNGKSCPFLSSCGKRAQWLKASSEVSSISLGGEFANFTACLKNSFASSFAFGLLLNQTIAVWTVDMDLLVMER